MRKLLITEQFDVNRKFRQGMMRMREMINHENVAKFIGLTWTNQEPYLVEEYCEKGQLVNFLQETKYNLTESFRYSVAEGIAHGMTYLHKHNIVNGCLKMSSCLIDSRWTVKIVGWEYVNMYDIIRRTKMENLLSEKNHSLLFVLFKQLDNATQDMKSQHEFWTPPEVLKYNHIAEPTKAGDVYTFGLIVYNIFACTNNQPSKVYNPTMNEIKVARLDMLKHGQYIPAKAKQIIELACSEEPNKRPSFDQLTMMLRTANVSGIRNVLDNIMETMESYINDLEDNLERTLKEHVELKIKEEQMAVQLIPKSIFEKVINGKTTQNIHHDPLISACSDGRSLAVQIHVGCQSDGDFCKRLFPNDQCSN